ncbi:MAG: hypothetical protein Ct9H300mP25_06900 [Acidobacteriota bacterium]|nr:MAG: hypothetical protein Ct9H300mP25_06900 [Acidobacteriota bacterium]
MAIRLGQVTITVTVLLVGLLVCGVGQASAQSQWKTLSDRAYININGAFQGTTDTAFTEALTETLYGEVANYELKKGLSVGGSTFDVGFGARVWKIGCGSFDFLGSNVKFIECDRLRSASVVHEPIERCHVSA